MGLLSKLSKAVSARLLRNDPEFIRLQQEAAYIGRHLQQSDVSGKAKLYPPYRISSSQVGDYTYLAENAKLSMVTIGKFCSIGPGFLAGYGIHPLNGISTSPMFYSTLGQNGTTLSSSDKAEERKPIVIGNDVFIGANVIVLDGVTIGDGAVIGAGAVVSKDIPPYAIAAGSPIQVLRYRFPAEQVEQFLKLQWWNFDEEKLTSVEKHFFDPEAFLKHHSNG